MSSNSINPKDWKALAVSINALPDVARAKYVNTMHIFAHDLRQPLAQIHSAEELLRRFLEDIPESEEILELLDVIKMADQHAHELLAEFAESHLEGIKTPDPTGLNADPASRD
jgi:signal transduction histidine kinase